MHLSTDSDKEVKNGEAMYGTYINELMHILDIYLVAANSANEIHEAELTRDKDNPSGKNGKMTNRGNDAVIGELFSFGKCADTEEHLEEEVNGI